MTRVLDGQVALVTGAARGLGRAFAEALGAQGAHIVACDRRQAVHEIEGLSYVAGRDHQAGEGRSPTPFGGR